MNIEKIKQLRILYVEDEKDLQKVIANFLFSLVEKIDVADNGEEAYELYVKNNYNVIITDINMPKLNGIDLIKKIRETNSSIPIIVTTAYNEKKYLEELNEIGMSEYLMKPLDVTILVERLVKVSP